MLIIFIVGWCSVVMRSTHHFSVGRCSVVVRSTHHFGEEGVVYVNMHLPF